MNIAVTTPALMEILAAKLLERSSEHLVDNQIFLAQAFAILKKWVGQNRALVDWVRPGRGAMCCMRLSRSSSAAMDPDRFWMRLSETEGQVAPRDWFGLDRTYFRVGFGHLGLSELQIALRELKSVLVQSRN